MNDKDQAAIDHVASVSKHPHAAMIVKQLITGWSVEFEYSTTEWKITDYPSWNHNSKYRLIEPKPAKPTKPAYRVYLEKYADRPPKTVTKGYYDKNRCSYDGNVEWISEWIEYDPPKKWPTPLVERIAAIDLEAAQWIVEHWDDLLDEKYTMSGRYSRTSNELHSMFYWDLSDDRWKYWFDISTQLGEQ